jgi:hypothetical protein
MNQRFDPNGKRPADPTTWPADDAARAENAPITGAAVPGTAGLGPSTTAPLGDPLAQRSVDPTTPPARAGRSSWPVLIILLAGLVLAMLVWLPAEMSNDASDTATQPAPAAETATPPADATTAPAATAPAATPPAATTPDATAPATPPAAPAQGAAPATGTAP